MVQRIITNPCTRTVVFPLSIHLGDPSRPPWLLVNIRNAFFSPFLFVFSLFRRHVHACKLTELMSSASASAEH